VPLLNLLAEPVFIFIGRVGMISEEPFEIFQKIRDEIGADDHFGRCERYGLAYLNLLRGPRRQ
jgi:hypothetical protein